MGKQRPSHLRCGGLGLGGGILPFPTRLDFALEMEGPMAGPDNDSQPILIPKGRSRSGLPKESWPCSNGLPNGVQFISVDFGMNRRASTDCVTTMRTLAGATAILTGANGGIGTHLTRTLANEGMNLLLVAYPGVGLSTLQTAIQGVAPRAEILVADLRLHEERVRVVETVVEHFGGVDLLVNNAGVEFSAAFHELPVERIRETISVNLEAPITLTHLVLPLMLRQGRGHIVNMCSLAGKSGPGFQEPYVATKAGLSAFTLSLRSTYRGTGVSASAVTPGFVEAGIYTRLKQRTGRSAPVLLGTCTPQRVCRAVVRAIRTDAPEIILNPYPIRPILALSMLFPRLGEWITERTGVNDFFRQAAGAAAMPRPGSPAPPDTIDRP